MSEAVFAMAERYGVRVEYADLGSWGADELRSEYDPDGPVIRVNERLLRDLPAEQAARAAALCIAHELYHHREHIGETQQLSRRSDREAAAQAFADNLVNA